MAEALVSVIGGGRFVGYSAGSHPTGRVNPFAVELTTQIGYPADRLRSKSWDEFAAPDAPQMDFIIVCDNAAGEVCPYWPGKPATAHWGFADPAAVGAGAMKKKRQTFRRINEITQRARAFRKPAAGRARRPVAATRSTQDRRNAGGGRRDASACAHCRASDRCCSPAS